MSIDDNINNMLNRQFSNHDYLPQKLALEDLDQAAYDFISTLNITLYDGVVMKKVDTHWLNAEKWAELRNNWRGYRDEGGKEATMPFMTMRRLSVKHSEAPLKRWTIPAKKTFEFLKVPILEGNLKGYQIYKIPQAPRVDAVYELRLFSHFFQHVNSFYETILSKGFSNGQAYVNVLGHYVYMEMGDPTEENNHEEVMADRKYQIVIPITLHGKLVDPKEFEVVKTITKINLDIKEG